MKIWKSEHIYDHPWETVAKAAWRKYPNPINPAVLGTDVIDRKVVKGVLHSHRLVASKWPFPRWATSFVGSTNICYASEYSLVDPKQRQMTLRTRNLTFGSVMAVDETVTYMPHPEDSNKTLQRQEAIVTVQGMPLESYMENLMANKISVNAGKGRQAIEWVIGKLQAEMKEIASNAIYNTDDLISFTKKSLQQVTYSVDDISLVTKKSIEDLQNLQSTPQSVPTP